MTRMDSDQAGIILTSFNQQFKKEQERDFPLDIAKHQEWFDVIISDDVEKAESIFSSVSQTEIHRLINVEFDFESDPLTTVAINNKFRILIPFHIAMAFCAKGVVKLFLTNGAEIHNQDQYKRNVLHSCIILAISLPSLETQITEIIMWFAKEVGDEDWQALLYQENEDGLRPLECAAQQGCLKIMKTLLESPGHCFSQKISGMGLFRKHDVTDYEIGTRHGKSPLHMIAFLDESKLQDSDTAKVLLSPLIKCWIDSKIQSNLVLIIAWVFMRFSFMIAYFMLDVDVGWIKRAFGNASESLICPELDDVDLEEYDRRFFTATLFIFAFLVLVLDVVDLISWRIRKHYLKNYNFNGKKTLINNTTFFLANNLILTLVVTFCVAFYMVSNIFTDWEPGKVFAIFTDIARGLVPVLCLWYVAYFMQLIPYIGFSIINVQQMVAEMMKFLLIFIMCIVPFVHVFESFIMANSKSGCVSEFNSPQMSAYTLFRTMLGQYDLSTLDVGNIGVVYVFHMMYTFLVGIVMLNFLIAIMSSTAAVLSENQSVILTVNQLAVAVRLEERIFWYSKFLYQKMRKLGFHCENDQVYITSIASRKEELFKDRDFL